MVAHYGQNSVQDSIITRHDSRRVTLTTGGRSKLAFHIYGDPGLFTVISSRFKVNSKVVAARLTKDNVPVLDLGEEYVTAVFDLFEVFIFYQPSIAELQLHHTKGFKNCFCIHFTKV